MSRAPIQFEEKPGRSRSSRRPAWGALSGGPIFGDDGRICGHGWITRRGAARDTRRVLTNQRTFHITPCIVLPATEDRSAEPVIAHRGLRAFTYAANLQHQRVAA